MGQCGLVTSHILLNRFVYIYRFLRDVLRTIKLKSIKFKFNLAQEEFRGTNTTIRSSLNRPKVTPLSNHDNNFIYHFGILQLLNHILISSIKKLTLITFVGILAIQMTCFQPQYQFNKTIIRNLDKNKKLTLSYL